MKWKHRVGVKSISHQGVTIRQMSLSNEETCQSKQIAQCMVTHWTVPQLNSIHILPWGESSGRIAAFTRRKDSNCLGGTACYRWIASFPGRKVNNCLERVASFLGRKVSNCWGETAFFAERKEFPRKQFSPSNCSPSSWQRKRFHPSSCSPSFPARKQLSPSNCSPSSQGRKQFTCSRQSLPGNCYPSSRWRQQFYHCSPSP